MSKNIYLTRAIPEIGIKMLLDEGFSVDVNKIDDVLSREALIAALKAKPYDAVICLLTDKIDAAIMDACPTVRIFANYAVGFDNINLDDARARGLMVTNTPGALTNAVAEHTFALILAVARRVAEGDRFVREGKYTGWAPMLLLGQELAGKTLGLLGAGRIGSLVAKHAKAFDFKVIYYDVKKNDEIEQATGAEFRATPEEVLKEADIVSIHVPLLETTKHLINRERLALMKKNAILINTSRGAVIDEDALVDALRAGTIWGAGLDVYENEPKMASGLVDLPRVVLTPHIASATNIARDEMAVLAAQNVIDFLEGNEPKNAVKG